MKIDPSVKPALWGAVGGAVALAIVGFAWGGWKTAASARDLVQVGSQKAVVVALAPFCVDKFNAQTDASVKLDELKKLPAISRATSSRRPAGRPSEPTSRIPPSLVPAP